MAMETAISIRPYRFDDAAALHEAAIESVSEIRPFMPWCRPDLTLDAARCWIEAQVMAFATERRESSSRREVGCLKRGRSQEALVAARHVARRGHALVCAHGQVIA
jgi:hypothetical protein